MAATRAQQSRKGKKNYGRNYQRGRTAEHRTARQLRRQGYSVTVSKGSRGPSDVHARKGKASRRIQVKHISSRTFRTETAARRRMQGQPFNVPRGRECWVTDAKGKTWKFWV